MSQQFQQPQPQQPGRTGQQADQPGQSISTPTSRGRMFPTGNYLDAETRRTVVDLLNQLLADTTDLQAQAKYAHWNVKGMNFFQLHELFDELAEVLETHQDEIAERATALGGQAMGTARLAASNSRLPEPRYDAFSGPECVEMLANTLAIHDANLAEAMRTADGYGDLDTTDLLNEISREVSQYLWFLEAHLQAGSAPTVGTTGGQGQSGTASGQGSLLSDSR